MWSTYIIKLSHSGIYALSPEMWCFGLKGVWQICVCVCGKFPLMPLIVNSGNYVGSAAHTSLVPILFCLCLRVVCMLIYMVRSVSIPLFLLLKCVCINTYIIQITGNMKRLHIFLVEVIIHLWARIWPEQSLSNKMLTQIPCVVLTNWLIFLL